jgi:uncharacterized protein YkwD
MSRQASRVTRKFATVVAFGLALSVVGLPHASTVNAGPTPAQTDSFLTWVNYYRMMSGLPKVTENASFQNGARLHSCYMLQNGITHYEEPGKPGYTVEGAAAGANSNVAVNSAANAPTNSFVDLWMTGPFHAIGLLRPGLRQIGSGRCDVAEPYAGQKWRSAATVDVLRGLDTSVRPKSPIVFPGNGSTVRMSRFIAETPDPRTFCGWSGATVGLPLLVQLPEGSDGATATMSGPSGPLTVCTLTNRNTSGTAASLLGTNSVVVLPSAQLQNGSYRVTLRTNYRTVTWGFTVDPNGGAPDPTTSLVGTAVPFTSITPSRLVDTRRGHGMVRLAAAAPQRVQVTGALGIPQGATAAAVNVTAVAPSGAGYLTAYPCGAVPTASTSNYAAGDVVANGAVVPLDPSGGFCIFSAQPTDVLVDVTGYFSPSSNRRFNPMTPVRMLDTRHGLGGATRVVAGGTVAVTIAGLANIPAGSSAAAVNITSVNPAGPGFLIAYPCGTARPDVSTVNFRAGETRANNALAGLGGGKLCIFSSQTTDILVDVSGFFASYGRAFQALNPVRIVDTRTAHFTVSGGQMGQPVAGGATVTQTVAGQFGIPANAVAVVANVVAVEPRSAGYMTAYPPQQTPPNVSTLNFAASNTVANGTHTILGSGRMRVFTSATAHVIVDVYGVWV